MDTQKIIEKEGYRFADLNDKHKEILRYLRDLEGAFAEGFEYDSGYDYGLVGDLKQEIAEDVIEQVKTWLAVQIAEYQIGFAESE